MLLYYMCNTAIQIKYYYKKEKTKMCTWYLNNKHNNGNFLITVLIRLYNKKNKN